MIDTVKIVVYLYDGNGIVFYEKTPNDSEFWIAPMNLRTNYSVIYPEADKNDYFNVDQMDIDD
jgi:hypothetical protein